MRKQIHDVLRYVEIATTEDFYRMRKITDRRNGIEYTEMFHIPITMRRQVGTERFSTPGYPCLYLGKSIYVCWEEMGRPVMNTCWCSRIKPRQTFRVLDLRMPTQEEFSNDLTGYMTLLPLIIACMIPIQGKATDAFKPEYLIPQLIMEWIIKEGKFGVYYTTTHLTQHTRLEFDYPRDKYDNLAIPIKSPLLRNIKNCPDLASKFLITTPANYEIETLKHSNDIAMVDLNADEKEENYRTSTFGVLEDYLHEENVYALHELN